MGKASLNAPWIDDELKRLLEARRKAWKNYRRFPSGNTFQRYKMLREMCLNERNRKRQQYREIAELGPAAYPFYPEPIDPRHEFIPLHPNRMVDVPEPDDFDEEFEEDFDEPRPRPSITYYPKASVDNDDSSTPSSVLFIRHMPSDISEDEFSRLAAPFGIINNMVLTRNGGFGLIELSDLAAAKEMHNYYKNVFSPIIRDSGPFVVTYSRYSSLNVEVRNQQVVEAIANANKHYNTMAAQGINSRRVLRVQLLQAPFDLQARCLDFHRIFSKFGNILRIVTFKSGSIPNALVEFETAVSARVALIQTDDTPVNVPDTPYTRNRCIARVEFSRQPSIDVRFDDEYGRDFVRNPLPGTKRMRSPARAPINGSTTNEIPSNILDLMTEDRLGELDANTLSELAKRMVKPLLKAALTANEQQSDLLKSQAEVLDRLAPSATPSKNKMPKTAATPTTTPNANRAIKSPVVFVSNLVAERVNTDTLFMLFGVYGEVLRVQILPPKYESALIQFADCPQAQRAADFLNQVSLYGKPINCSLSKNTNVIITVPNKEDSSISAERIRKFNRDYTGHRLNRFRRANTCNTEPTKFLHITNLPEGVSEDDLTESFEENSEYRIVKVNLSGTAKPSAVVEMADVDTAVAALIAMNDHELDRDWHMRITFAKSP